MDLGGTIEPYLLRRAKSQAEFMKYRLNLPTDRTRSDLERDLLRFFSRHGFPRPEGAWRALRVALGEVLSGT